MAVQWTGDLRRIVDNARHDASRIQVRMNTALILRSMIRTDGPLQEILTSYGLGLNMIEDGMRTLPSHREPEDALQRLYERAGRLAVGEHSQDVTAVQMLLAMLDEPCMAQTLLRALKLDLTKIRGFLMGYARTGQTVQVERSRSQSMNAVAVQTKSMTPLPTRYIEPTPSVSFGDAELADKPAPRRLLTPGEIERLGLVKNNNEPKEIPQNRTNTASQNRSKEMQRLTTLELAIRLKQKQTQSNEYRSVSKSDEFKPVSEEKVKERGIVSRSKDPNAQIGEKVEVKGSEVNEVKAKETAVSEAPAKKVSEAVTSAPKKVHGNISSRTLAGTMVRQNALSEGGSVYSRKASSSSFKIGSIQFNPRELSRASFPTLCQYGRNLLDEAAKGKIDPVINREHEIDQLIDVLNKRRCNNPILVGEPGVGKTAIIEGLALRMANHEAPKGLDQKTIIALDYGSILCGTQLRGAVQERIKGIKNEVNLAKGHIILFLDEIHSWLSGANGDPNGDAALELKMALSRGELICIGASTPQELRKVFNADPTFERRFDYIEVKAPDAETSVRIIEQGIIRQYAAHHNVTYTSEAVSEAVRLSERYIQERALPDKAISVLDRAGSICERAAETVVTSRHVAQVIAQIAEVPVERLLMTERQKLLKMEEILGRRLVGHEENIKRIANVIRRNHAGFGAQRPIGSFLFLGPTGVGKTESAKVLADYLFGSPKNIVRFDMSEFMEQHSVAKLIGAPAGYVGFDDGGLLTEALRKRPYQIVLFDEIEKAHPDVMNILLQILEEGRLTDAKGRHVSFSNAVIILTSNIGAKEAMNLSQNIGFAESGKPTPKASEATIIKAAKSYFTPELWNRIEEKLVFMPLTLEQIEKIAHLLLVDSSRRLYQDKHIVLSFDEDSVIPYLIDNGGFNPTYGARPMRRTIQSHLESQIAEWILSHESLPKELYISVREGQVLIDEVKPFTISSV